MQRRSRVHEIRQQAECKRCACRSARLEFRRLAWLCFALLVSNGVLFSDLHGQISLPDVRLSLGFDGHVRLGKWQPFFVETRQPVDRFELTVPDGDETPVTYSGALHKIGQKDGFDIHQGFFKLGRGAGRCQLRLGAGQAATNLVMDVDLKDLPDLKVLSSTQRVVVTIESGQSLAETIRTTVIGEKDQSTVVSLNRASQLPIDWSCYEGVKTVFLAGDRPLIESITPNQCRALSEWLTRGGQIIVSVNPEHPSFYSENGILQTLLSAKFKTARTIVSSNRLDGYAGSSGLVTKDKEPFPVAELESSEGITELEQDGMPMVIRYPKGFGELVLVAFDLNHPRILKWSGSKGLVFRLEHAQSLQEAAQNQRVGQLSGSVSHPGFEDLIGQLRMRLEKFSNVRFISFNWVALLIGMYILCIGPGDYFFLRKFTRKMEMTWITFPLISLLFCGLAIWIAKRTRADEIQLNQLEIVDIDSQSQLARGTVWTNLYSPRSSTLGLKLEPIKDLNLQVDYDRLTWHGLPGRGYGGMDTDSNPVVSRQGYRQTISTGFDDIEPSKGSMFLEGVPTNVSSTRSVLSEYGGKLEKKIQSNLKVRLKIAGLEGTISNPFDFPLKNCRLAFEDSVYLLSKPWEPGEVIAVESEMKERTLSSYLTRRRAVEDDVTRSQNSQWDINEPLIQRIGDIMMLYQAAGGATYTSGLTHAYQERVDLSRHLSLGRAVLIAELGGRDEKRSSIRLTGDQGSGEYDQTATMLRIVLPVHYLEKKR